jgi:hypothetical protein
MAKELPMNNASTQISTTPVPAVTVPPPLREPRVDRWKPLKNLLKPLASLRLTVVLFALSMFLVFCGTLAQMDNGLWAILSGYFRAWLAWIPFQVFVRFGQVFFWFPKTWYVSGSFPFPGGYILGGALLINLIAAHLVRFRLSWKRSGILLTHAGLIILMLGELVTGLFAVEGTMTIETGQSSNYVEHADKVELAFIDSSNPKTDHVIVVPGYLIKGNVGGLIANEQLPVDIEVNRYMLNSSEPRNPKPGEENPATRGTGLETIIDETKPGVAVDPNQKRDVASAYVTFRKKGSSELLGTYLMSVWLRAQTLKVDGKEYQVALRPEREYTPYTLLLEEFHHDVYPGTDIPKNYSSKIRLFDPEQHEDREVLIYMNNPLRYRGATFYQASFLGGDSGTVLQVVRNPGWLMPYISCTMVALGMVIHFGMNLLSFLQRRTTP